MIQADPFKTTAIAKMKAPESVHVPQLRHFMGMVNQLGRFSPNHVELTQPLREILSKKAVWLWGCQQEQAFSRVKEPTVLLLYHKAETKISTDTSSYGLGAVLLQKSEE